MEGVVGGGSSVLLKFPDAGWNLEGPMEGLRLPLVDWRRSIPRTSSMETERSKSGGVSIPAIEWVSDLGVVGSMRSLGLWAVSAAG